MSIDLLIDDSDFKLKKLDNPIKNFFSSLNTSDFKGDIVSDKARCLVYSTDNSIYQAEPLAVIFPKNSTDLQKIVFCSYQSNTPITVRGGGTGTNAQSLNNTVIVDVSRYLTNIIAFDEQSQTIIVETGLVLDKLNDFLSKKGYFFPPAISSSWGATLGGMFATDASGQGSRVYGKTSDYIINAKILLANGDWKNTSELQQDSSKSVKAICKIVKEEIENNQQNIAKVFPSINRSLTGYNLRDALKEKNLNFNQLLAGSEGTLALTYQLTLKVLKKPNYRGLTVVGYDNYYNAVNNINHLLKANPIAIELLDDKIIQLAKESSLSPTLNTLFTGEKKSLLLSQSFLFIEFSANDEQTILQGQQQLKNLIDSDHSLGVIETHNSEEINNLWSIRKQAVGLLSAPKTKKGGWAFIEDCAVDVKNLAPFIKSFRAVLDSYHIEYGMYGHADVGCIHVRPLLDMRQIESQNLIRPLSVQVAKLTKKYGGVFWGEHGKGVRGEFLKDFVGEEIYLAMRKIKTAFDPSNCLNPYKLFVSIQNKNQIARSQVYSIDELTFRGQLDSQINTDKYPEFEPAIRCNGNGLCFSGEANSLMCPSYKATNDRTQSPKGRAALFREWARLKSSNQSNSKERKQLTNIESELYHSLQSCLSCKACHQQCSARVNVADMKAAFLVHYFQKQKHSIQQWFLKNMESWSLFWRKQPAIANRLIDNFLSTWVINKLFKLNHLPLFTTSIEKIAKENGLTIISKNISVGLIKKENSVCLLVDSFIGCFATQLVLNTSKLLQRMGFTVFLTPVIANGKAQYLNGYQQDFNKTQQSTLKTLTKISSLITVVSLEPAITDFINFDFQKNSSTELFLVKSLESFLTENSTKLQSISNLKQRNHVPKSYYLMSHCTEKTMNPNSVILWQTVFLTLKLDCQTVQTGCCGMAGVFGHQSQNQKLSKKLFDLSWRNQIKNRESQMLITGFSCRSQIALQMSCKAQHPVEVLLNYTKS